MPVRPKLHPQSIPILGHFKRARMSRLLDVPMLSVRTGPQRQFMNFEPLTCQPIKHLRNVQGERNLLQTAFSARRDCKLVSTYW